jgi:hypothetical protein
VTDRPRLFAIGVLAVVGVILLVTAIPGVFIIDEDSYIQTIAGLQHGDLAVPGTAGLPPSPELFSFDANGKSRVADTTPVYSVSPPLYAPIALPFAALGLRGLIALQVLSFLGCAYLVFAFVRRETGRLGLAWFALGTFVLASFTIEYAQGIWPQALAMLLVMAAVDLSSRLRAGAALWLAPVAGLCAGVAAGVRYQNLAIAALVAVTLLWCARGRRVRVLAGFALGCAIPLAISAAMNARRFDTWNPVSKGPAYRSGEYVVIGQGRSPVSAVTEAIAVTWARVVDQSTWPEFKDEHHRNIMPKDPRTGVFRIQGALKKALLQSAPWVIVPLIALALAWRRRAATPPNLQRELRALSIVVAGVIGMFAMNGFARHEGWAFNQRYFVELMPLFAVGFGLALAHSERAPPWRPVVLGALLAILVAIVVFRLRSFEVARHIVLMKLPLAIAASLAALWLLARAGRVRAGLAAGALGAALGWAGAVHVGDDLAASRRLRDLNARRLELVEATLPAEPKSAVFAWANTKDALGPLVLGRDVVIVDPWLDGGRDSRKVLDALLAQGRVVYLIRTMSHRMMAHLIDGREVEEFPEVPWVFIVRPAPAGP